MNIILLEKNEVRRDRVLLDDHRAKHIVKVLKSQVGDVLRIGMLDGDVGEGRVESFQPKFPFSVELSVTLTASPVPAPAIDLVLALPRPIMLKRILSQVTSLGVGRIYIINANRVEKSFWKAGILDPEEYMPHLIQGLEQAVDTRLPDIQIRQRFRPFIEDEFPQIAREYSHLLLAHPDGKGSLAKSMEDTAGRVLYAVGPEGGWVDFEVEQFCRAGMQIFSMGERILKVDTATIAIHSRIMQQFERNGCAEQG